MGCKYRIKPKLFARTRPRNFTCMSKKIWFYSLFFILLILGFYFMLTLMIPGFGKVGLQKLNKVQDFSFLDQNGDRITNRDVEGKVYVAEFFYNLSRHLSKDEYEPPAFL